MATCASSKCRPSCSPNDAAAEEQVIGLHYKQFLDPAGRSPPLSSGMRSLFEDLDSGPRSATRAILSADRQRWWSISGKPIHDEKGAGRLARSRVRHHRTRLHGNDAVRAARTDPLTGLANRLLVRELLEEAVLRQWAAKPAARCCWSTSTGSSWSTTRSAMRLATSCWWRSARGWSTAPARAARVGRIGGDEFAVVWSGGCDRTACSRRRPDHRRPVEELHRRRRDAACRRDHRHRAFARTTAASRKS